jgi:hypothetical protein
MEPRRSANGKAVTGEPDRSAAALLTLIIGLPLGLILAAFPLVSTTFFQKYCDKPDIQRLTSPFLNARRQCDVVIFGDSTAQVGLDPLQITKMTHLTTCNIAVNFPTIAVLGSDPLERFLSANRHPSLLVLSFAPGDFVPTSPNQTGLAWDGMILAIRLDEWRAVARAIVQNPDRIFAVINYAYLGGSLSLLKSIMHHHGLEPSPEGEGTHYTIPTGPLKSCVPTRAVHFLPDVAYIASLRTRFASRADHLIIDVSPTSPCIDMFPKWLAALDHITDNDLPAYPFNLFADDYYHLTAAGAVQYSEEVATQILKTTTRISHDSVSSVTATPELQRKNTDGAQSENALAPN